MADPLFVPIKAFGEKLDFPVAFNYSLTQILEFLKNVAENPGGYGVPNPTVRGPYLQRLYNNINGLKYPNGTLYTQFTPPVQLLRTANALAPTELIPWAPNDKKEKFFTIFDLLGIFLALLGPAPSRATAKNYHLPLVVVYARWCIKLAPPNGADPGSALTPSVVQITWATRANGDVFPFVGASAQGFKVEIKENDPDLGTKLAAERKWRNLVQQTRYDLLNNVLQAPYKGKPNESPVRDKQGGRGQKFGNCGETYPFLYILSDPSLRCSGNGIAIVLKSLGNRSTYNGLDYWKEGAIIPPCDNCKVLTRWFSLPDFTPYIARWK